MRKVRGLRWATFSHRGPPTRRTEGRRHLTASQRRGLRYERRVERPLRQSLPPETELVHGQWIAYKDQGGLGLAQPDYYAVNGEFLWIFECKLTYTDIARQQLQYLYSPLLAHIYPDLHQILVIIAKNLTPSAPLPVADLEEVFDLEQEVYLWHLLA